FLVKSEASHPSACISALNRPDSRTSTASFSLSYTSGVSNPMSRTLPARPLASRTRMVSPSTTLTTLPWSRLAGCGGFAQAACDPGCPAEDAPGPGRGLGAVCTVIVASSPGLTGDVSETRRTCSGSARTEDGAPAQTKITARTPLQGFLNCRPPNLPSNSLPGPS